MCVFFIFFPRVSLYANVHLTTTTTSPTRSMTGASRYDQTWLNPQPGAMRQDVNRPDPSSHSLDSTTWARWQRIRMTDFNVALKSRNWMIRIGRVLLVPHIINVRGNDKSKFKRGKQTPDAAKVDYILSKGNHPSSEAIVEIYTLSDQRVGRLAFSSKDQRYQVITLCFPFRFHRIPLYCNRVIAKKAFVWHPLSCTREWVSEWVN